MNGFFNWKRRDAGMSRSTLHQMFHMDSAQLSDMGLTRHDIADALRSSDAGQLLAARRNARASAWLR